jgi:hypothetical protein
MNMNQYQEPVFNSLFDDANNSDNVRRMQSENKIVVFLNEICLLYQKFKKMYNEYSGQNDSAETKKYIEDYQASLVKNVFKIILVLNNI